MQEDTQILASFVTKLPAELHVPRAPVAVPTTLKRYGLSQIINHMLGLDPPRPFDFVINGELVRKSLEAHLKEHNLSTESVLEVEYVPAVVPPKHERSAPHDDWVRAVDGGWGGARVVSGGYDGCARLWDLSGEPSTSARDSGSNGSNGSAGGGACSVSWHAHAGGVNGVACVGPEGGAGLVVTVGKDRGVRLWQVSAKGGAPPHLIASYAGHTDAVEGVAVSPDATRMATCGWDGGVRLWRTGAAVVEDAAAAAAAGAGAAAAGAGAKKKRKVATPAGPAPAPEGGLQEEALACLQGHVHCVAAATFAGNGVLFTGGWDHSVRRWDAATGINTDTYNGSKAVFTVACPGSGAAQSGSLVLFGGSDRTVRLWDARAPRASGDALALKGCVGHGAWVVGAAWRPGHDHHVATASHDHAVKVWDTRTSVPLASLDAHTDKALCVGWAGPGTLLSGGADCKMLSYSMEQGLPA